MASSGFLLDDEVVTFPARNLQIYLHRDNHRCDDTDLQQMAVAPKKSNAVDPFAVLTN